MATPMYFKRMIAQPARARPSTRSRIPLSAGLVLLALGLALYTQGTVLFSVTRVSAPYNAAAILAQCSAIDAKVGPVSDFADRRVVSDRFVQGTTAVLIKNATLWTGDGIVEGGELLLANGLIKHVGGALTVQQLAGFGYKEAGIQSFNALGGWITPAIVDAHSHAGDFSLPALNGAKDFNSRLGIVQPWLRSLDGLNTHDAMFELSVAGGVGTALILPGSANAIGGQAFAIKLRPTVERSPSSMLVDAPFTYNGSGIIPSDPPKWRHLKQACGENPSRTYGGTRMDSLYAMRTIYTAAKQLKEKQDAFCASARAGEWANLGEFPEDLRYEMLVDVLRGRVKVQTHCYEAVDLDNLVRLSNEFKFPIAAFHHAHETYLVPEVLKKAYGGAPASAIFAAFGRYKREAYRHSEYAARVLHDNGLPVIMKSDHPDPVNMRDLLFEAQQAHYHGLPTDVALASVMSTPAKVLGLDHRLGFLRRGYDADIVLWDSHPLQLGATPAQVFIDGIPQLDKAVITHKSLAKQRAPKTPNFDEETEKTIEHEGLPPLEPIRETRLVRFVNVGSVWTPGPRRGVSVDDVDEPTPNNNTEVVVCEGRIVCQGECSSFHSKDEVVVDLKGGEIAPGLTAIGGYALAAIASEDSTADGDIPDPLPSLLGPDALVRVVDGLSFGLRNEQLAYRSGVTGAVVLSQGYGIVHGVGAHISLAARHKLEDGAVPKPFAVISMSIEKGGVYSVSTQVGALRNLLNGGGSGDLGKYFKQIVEGELPLLIKADGADIIASIIELKTSLGTDSKARITIAGATEAHLLAAELAAANIGVIVNPRPIPLTWDMQRIARRPPLAKGNAVTILRSHGVTVAVSPVDMWAWRARQQRFNLGWILAEADGALTHNDAIALGSQNLEKLLGLDINDQDREMVAYAGGDIFSFESKAVAVIRPLRARVDLL